MYLQRLSLILATCLFLLPTLSAQEITATVNRDKSAEMSNGIIDVKINSKGHVTYFSLNGKDVVNADNGGRFYFSYNSDTYNELAPHKASVTRLTDSLVEIKHEKLSGELLVEQSYILLKDVPGAYCYITLKGSRSPVSVAEMRVVFRVDPDQFTYAYVSDAQQGPMVSPADLTNVEEIMDATYRLRDGSIYTKYDWANYVDNDIVHGLCNEETGVWVVSSSDEYLNGGPMKQELMVHGTSKTPLALKMLQGQHFGAGTLHLEPGEEKIYGPFFIYANAGNSKEELIEDAKNYAQQEQAAWPYTWMDNPLYPTQRTTVHGQLQPYFDLSPENMMVVLAEHGSTLYEQGKDYMYWTKADANGHFTLPHVRENKYSLYVFATEGEMFDELEFENIEVSGESVDLGVLSVVPEKFGQLVWQLGTPDRTAREFRLADEPRAYGMWDRVPANLTYTIGESEPDQNWYYAQTKEGKWNIRFTHNREEISRFSYLKVAIAGAASSPTVDVYMNNRIIGRINGGNDASVYRSANQGGRYQLKTFRFFSSYLNEGENTLTFQMEDVGNRGGLMYDAIKLETGDILTDIEDAEEIPSALAAYPNPFTETLHIQTSLPYSGKTRVVLLDVSGRQLATVYDGNLSAGAHSFVFEQAALPQGLYFLQLTNENYSERLKIIRK